MGKMNSMNKNRIIVIASIIYTYQFIRLNNWWKNNLIPHKCHKYLNLCISGKNNSKESEMTTQI